MCGHKEKSVGSGHVALTCLPSFETSLATCPFRPVWALALQQVSRVLMQKMPWKCSARTVAAFSPRLMEVVLELFEEMLRLQLS